MKWQPIDTAPRDGTEIIAASIYEAKGRPRVWTVYLAAADGARWMGTRGGDVSPTHWMPLPSVEKPDVGDADETLALLEEHRIRLMPHPYRREDGWYAYRRSVIGQGATVGDAVRSCVKRMTRPSVFDAVEKPTTKRRAR